MTRKVKNSGIRWIGKIPDDWQVIKGKYLFNKMDRPIEVEETVTAFRDGQVVQRKKRRIDGFTNSLKEIGYQGVKQGDLVIHSMDAFAGAIGISEDDGKCSPVCIILDKKSDTVNNLYFSYLMRVYSNLGYIESMAKGIRVRSTDFKYTTFANTLLLVPTISEQKNIVNYIVDETSHTDKLIIETKKSIIELKKYKQSIITEVVTKGLDLSVEMKDSGISWIGNIPNHWKINKMKFVTRIKEVKQDFIKGDPYIGLENVESFSGRINGFSKLEKKSKGNAFNVGDILYSKLRPYLAKAFIANMSGSCSGEFIVFSQYQGNKKYLLYWLVSQLFTEYINATSYGAKMPRSSWDYIKETSIPQPPKEEELSIVNYIENKTTHIDKLILKKEKVIKELEQYKISLIYEYVTGKKKCKEV